MSLIIREALSLELYKLIKNGNESHLVQVLFVNKDGEPLVDEEFEYVNVMKAVEELLEAGASPLYFLTDKETFLLPLVINELKDNAVINKKTKEKMIDLLIKNVTTNELKGLLPTHSNLLFKKMLYNEQELDKLISKGLQFKQDIDNINGNDAVEVESISNGDTKLFLKIAQSGMNLDFDLIYNKDKYNETTLKEKLEHIRKIVEESEKNTDLNENKYKMFRHQKRKELINFLDKWILKNKISENNPKTQTKINAGIKI